MCVNVRPNHTLHTFQLQSQTTLLYQFPIEAGEFKEPRIIPYLPGTLLLHIKIKYHFFTARIQRMGEGNIFSLSTLVGGGVTPPHVCGWWVPHPRSGGVPHLRSGGYPLRSGWWGGTSSQVLMVGGTPSQVWVRGIPSQV